MERLATNNPFEKRRRQTDLTVGGEDMRQFIRHPVDIPIEVSAAGTRFGAPGRASNVSLGGLAVQSAVRIEPGAVVEIRIDLVRPAFETRARVVWCIPRDGGYEIGMQFLTAEDAFTARMVEQVCHIQSYRRIVYETQHRWLTPQEAATEWISKHAAEFPEILPVPPH